MDKVLLITGASSGIGKEIALYYSDLNAKLSIADVDAINLEDTAQKCAEKNNVDLLKSVIDMTNDEDVRSLVEKTINKFGRIDILFNCAGILRRTGLLDDNLMEVFDKVVAVNLRSVVLLTSLCSPYLIKSKGCVVNIASIAAVLSIKNSIAYSVSKAGVDHFTRCAALELAGHGVRVNSVIPGVVGTNLYIKSGMSVDEYEAYKKSVEDTTPLNHLIETKEIVDLAAYLASDKARSMTGGSYIIDAGTVLSGYKYVKK